MPAAARRARGSAYVLVALAFALVVLNIGLAVKLSDLLATNYQGCLLGNELRADAVILLNENGHPVRAASPALHERPCKDLYGKGLIP